ncbi:nucleotide-diphospho-sugar transferase [Aspergillus tubingensis]|uniref:nucleotide-diphospho-sugar transferase n=1 Tax=Aspergillus tubingensis TaxID=5068 RepID=UPI0015778BFF|nr:nucleotide-diphospho-sugar transferase [Aspergillus tubingensis]GFN16080.1 nucleotide-diphospho-sugar transferase [Aspergillus tubingensis]
MEPAIIRLAQTYVGHVRRVGVSFCTLYMALRLSCLICAPETNYWMWVVLIFEALWTYKSLSMELPRRTGETSKQLHLTKNHALPSVDIMLPCCGEPIEIILDTIRAACVIDYPQTAFRVLILDDGNSPEVRQAVEELQHTWPNLLYYSRGTKPSQKVFAKAGNLNFGLFDVQGGMVKPPEFIAIFDSDFLPAPNFLRATLPHMLGGDNVGIMDEMGSSLATTSGCLMRRDLAVQVGGFPTLNEVEDMTLSFILPAYGKRVVYLTEMLQLGRVPSSLEGHVRQSRRWLTGLTEMIATPWAPSAESIPTSLRYSMAYFGIYWVLSPLGQSIGCPNPIIPGILWTHFPIRMAQGGSNGVPLVRIFLF